MLRDYQIKAIDEIKKHFATPNGTTSFKHGDDVFTYESRRRAILQLATGSGKTTVFCTILRECYKKGNTAIMVVKGAKLVHQAAQRLERENVPYGIYQASKTKDNHHPIQICSIDTLYRRKVTPPADLIVIDETHLTGGESYRWLTTQAQYKNSFFLGVSATPFSTTGLAHVGSGVVYPITINQLIEQGYLVGARYSVPNRPNLKGVKKTGGDYNLRDLRDRLNEDDEKNALYGSLTKHWLATAKGKRSLLFAIDRAHAKELKQQLETAGARVGYIDGNTPHDERDEIIGRLERLEIDVISSVGVLTTGVDIPSLQVLLICRPTASHNMWVQMVGRGTRIYQDKQYFEVIDFAGNTLKLGPIESEMIGQIEPTKNATVKNDLTMCEACYAAFPLAKRIKTETHWLCPECKSELKEIKLDAKGREIENKDGTLIEYEPEPWEIELPKLIDTAKKRGYKKGYVFHLIKTKYGEEAALKAWTRIKNLRRWPLKEVLPPTRNL